MLLLLAVPVLVLLAQVLLARFAPPSVAAAVERRPRIAVLMPAHNEANGIAEVIAGVKAQLVGDDRLIVVADNCSDDTAAIARGLGAEVSERFHNELRGKGYALDHGIRHLAEDPPEVVIIVDADCLLGSGALDRIARVAQHSGRPVQALYLMHAPEGARPMRKIAEFAWVVKNLVRPLGFQRIGMPCQLMGTGMAFSWLQLRNSELATGHIVEDMKLGVDLAKMDQAPLFCPDAMVYSHFPSSEAGAQTQRTRWEHGHLSVILNQVPALLFSAIRSGNTALAAMALDLCIPPLALLVMLVGSSWVLTLLIWLGLGLTAPFTFASVLLLAILAAILLAWSGFGRSVLTLGELLTAVSYVAKKLPLYLKFIVNRQVEWVRSKRDSE
ncbi:glycosyltransferase family 2 protein [Herbaspirillum lusitanum]|uniref:Glycosyltransferase family 2 protein n=1 Tax=Herbaspirillum lusitanum TaxID=213312 RepID=A0ABW9A7D5_9BURK